MIDDENLNNTEEKNKDSVISEESNQSEDSETTGGTTGSDDKKSVYEVLQDLVDNSEYGSGPLVNQIIELHKKVGIVKKVLERILMEKLGKWKKNTKQKIKTKEQEEEISKDIKNKLK
tara:strand:- start:12023 stop:12376 length:354 start_codon:yes stop_codon:yes gene_type:complete